MLTLTNLLSRILLKLLLCYDITLLERENRLFLKRKCSNALQQGLSIVNINRLTNINSKQYLYKFPNYKETSNTFN